MNKLNFIFNRHSIRKYTGQEVEDEKIDQLLHAAMAAPSARKQDPWRFIVVKEAQILQKLKKILPNGQFIDQAGTAIIVLGDINIAYANSLTYMLQDCSAAVENIMLAAAALDLGSCWLGVQGANERISALKSLFNLPDNIIPMATIAIGYPKEKVLFKSRYDSSYIHYNQW